MSRQGGGVESFSSSNFGWRTSKLDSFSLVCYLLRNCSTVCRVLSLNLGLRAAMVAVRPLRQVAQGLRTGIQLPLNSL
jgi:hypothetical protein